MEIRLRRFIGHQVVGMGPGPGFVDNEKLHSVKLLAVEEAGHLDREPGSRRLVIGRLQKKPSSAALAFFVPYVQIRRLVAGFEPSGIE
jgi:hypothetical protein